jgi:excisionase family DNA binding protein
MIQQQAQVGCVASSMAAWLTVHEAAMLLGITDRGARKLAEDGRVWAERWHGRWLLRLESVEDYAAAHRRPGTREAALADR